MKIAVKQEHYTNQNKILQRNEGITWLIASKYDVAVAEIKNGMD
jgi:hypothetical protein